MYGLLKDSEVLEELYKIDVETVKGVHYSYKYALRIVYVIKGVLSHELDGITTLLEPGDILVLNTFENRFLYSEDPDNLAIFLDIDWGFLIESNIRYKDIGFFNYIKTGRYKSFLEEKILEFYKETREDNLDIKLIHLNSIINLLMDEFINQDYKGAGVDDKLIYFKNARDDFYNGNIIYRTLNDISEEAHLSLSYVSKIFADAAGIKYTEYIQQLKLFLACSSLVKTSKTIDEVAEEVDFSSAKSLNRIFKKYLNTTPTQYRQEYRKTIEKENIDNKLDNLLLSVKSKDYHTYLREYYNKESLDIEIDLGQEANKDHKVFNNWHIIRSVETLGEDYVENLDKVLSKINIDRIFLRFRLGEDKETIYLTDIDQAISHKDLYSLFNICTKYRVTAKISIYNGDLNVDQDNIQEKMGELEDFYNLISNIIGNTNMINFAYVIDVKNIADYVDDPERLEIYRNYIVLQQRFLEEKMGTEDYHWGFELGQVDRCKLEKLETIYRKLYTSKNRFVPSFVSMEYREDMEEAININSLIELEEFRNYDGRIGKKISMLKGDLDFPMETAYIRGMYENVDISMLDYRYKDLFLVLFFLANRFTFDKDMNYVSEFKFKDKTRKSGYYYPKVVDQYGFSTPVYWSMYLLDKLKGEVVLDEKGCLAMKNGQDLYLAVYGDPIADYIYSSNKDFKNLKDDIFEFNIKIHGLRGKYKVTTELLSFENGSVYSNISEKDFFKYMSLEEREYVKRMSIPSFNLEIKQLEEEFIDKMEYGPFTCILRKYIKL